VSFFIEISDDERIITVLNYLIKLCHQVCHQAMPFK